MEIKTFLKELEIGREEPVVVAVSGGPDSMALLSLLEQYFKTIICVHVNHNTGRVGQIEEEVFVRNYCKQHHHIIETFTIKHYEKHNFHDQAHRMRYQFFEKILKQYDSHYLFTAHHGDDLMETMLFRMMRGSTLKALHGFSKISRQKDYWIIRPLLSYTKQQLLEYNQNNQVPYKIDLSNEKDIYTRNRIRKYMLPFLKQENENIHLKFLKWSEEFEQIDNYIEAQVQKELNIRFQENTLSLIDWYDLDIVIKKRMLQKILSYFYKDNQEQLKSIHVSLLLDLIETSRSGSKMDLPGDIYVLKSYDELKFFTKNKQELYYFELKEDLILPNGHKICFLEECDNNSNYVCRLNKEELELPLIVRTRKEQDMMLVKGLNGRKKIKEILINEKIPVYERQNLPIVTDKNGKIVWIPGIKKSQFDKTKDEKYDIILKYY